MLLVTVVSDGGINASSENRETISPVPVWFSTLDQKSAAEGDSEIVAARAFELDGKWDLAAENTPASFVHRIHASSHGRPGVRPRPIHHETWWWESGQYFPPIRWVFVHPRRTALAVPALLLILLTLRLLRQLKVFSLLGFLVKSLIVHPSEAKQS